MAKCDVLVLFIQQVLCSDMSLENGFPISVFYGLIQYCQGNAKIIPPIIH